MTNEPLIPFGIVASMNEQGMTDYYSVDEIRLAVVAERTTDVITMLPNLEPKR